MKRFSLLLINVLILGMVGSCGEIGYKKKTSAVEQTFLSEAKKAEDIGDYKKAAQLYKNIYDNNQSNKEIDYKYAKALQMQGLYQDAIMVYDKLLEIDANDINASEYKALCLLQLGDLDEAEKIFDSVLNKDAKRWKTVNALGIIKALEGNIDEAKMYYQIAIAIDDKNPSILNNIGLSMVLTSDRVGGIEVIKTAINNLPNNDPRRKKVEFNLALAYGISGQKSKAEAILKKYLSYEAIENNLAFYAKLSKDRNAAGQYLKKSL